MDPIERLRDRRQGDRQLGSERRSGVDKRTPEERLRQGERRINPDRRSNADRRKHVKPPTRASQWLTIAVVLGVLCGIDIRFFHGEHSSQAVVQAAVGANSAIDQWIGRGFNR